MGKEKIIRYCDRAIEFSLYGVAFYIPISIALVESLAGFSIFAWLVKKFIQRKTLKDFPKTNFLFWPVMFYFSACLLSSIFSSNQALSFRHLILKTTEYLLIFFIAAEKADKKFLRNIVIVLIVSASLVGIDGIFQYFTGWDFFRGRTPVILGRVNGPFTVPTDFAAYLVSLLPLVTCICFLRFKKIWVRFILIALTAIIFVSIILSASRSSWIALILAMPLGCIFLGKKKVIKIISLIILLIFISLLFRPDIAKGRITELFNKESRTHMFCDRPYLLETGYNMFLDRPVLGQGLGTFMYNYTRFTPFVKNNPYGEGPYYAHNCFLQIASETGLIGLLAFLLIVAWLYIVSLRALNKINREGFYYYAFAGLNIGIFAYLVSSFFDTNLYSLPLAVLFWLMLGLVTASKNIIESY